MKATAETFIFENINYLQLMLQNISEKEFDEYIARHQTSFQSIHSYLLNLVYQLNDNKLLNEDYLKGICHFLDIEQVDNVDTLIEILSDRRSKSDGLVPLTLVELQNMVQCIRFMAKDKCIDLNGIYGISEFIKNLRQTKRTEIA